MVRSIFKEPLTNSYSHLLLTSQIDSITGPFNGATQIRTETIFVKSEEC